MSLHSRRSSGAFLIIAGAWVAVLAGCTATPTQAPAVSPSGDATPSFSVSAEPQPSPVSTDLDVAADFTYAVWTSDYDTAGRVTAANSPAARYLAHQRASTQVDELNGNDNTTAQEDITVVPDPASNSLTITDTSGDTPTTYTWSNFTYTAGKVASWTGKSGPLDRTLWHSAASDTSKTATMRLVSAYATNAGYLNVVVELSAASSSRASLRLLEASFTPAGGYRTQDAQALSADVAPGEKTLTQFSFKKAKIPGTLRAQIDSIDGDDNSSSSPLTTLKLKVR